MDLLDYRKEIDAIDQVLTDLFQRRMDLAAQIAAYKQANNLPVLDAGREAEKLQAVSALVRPELQDYTKELYSAIFALSRSYQDRLMNR